MLCLACRETIRYHVIMITVIEAITLSKISQIGLDLIYCIFSYRKQEEVFGLDVLQLPLFPSNRTKLSLSLEVLDVLSDAEHCRPWGFQKTGCISLPCMKCEGSLARWIFFKKNLQESNGASYQGLFEQNCSVFIGFVVRDMHILFSCGFTDKILRAAGYSL